MSILRKCDICRKEFDFGFSVGVSLQGGLAGGISYKELMEGE